MKGFGENKNSKKRDKSFSKSNNNYVNNQLNLASNFFKTGNILLAEKIYSQLLKEGNRSYELLFSYALISRNTLKFKLAKDLLTQSISTYPTKIDHYILFAEILRLEKKFSKAKELLLTARRINSQNSNTLYNLSLLYRDLNETENAIENINHAIKLNPRKYIYNFLKADLLKDIEKLEESRAILNELYLSKNIKDKKDILFLLSNVEQLDSNFLNAEEILLKVIKDYPNFTDAYLNLSDLYFQQKFSKKAKDVISKGIKVNPNIPQMYVNYGMIARSLGDIKDAKKYFLKAISMDKNLFICYLSLSTFYDFADNPNELDYLLNLSIHNLNNNDKAKVFYSRANIYHRLRDFNEASKNYKLANETKRKICLSNKDQLLEKSNKVKKIYYENETKKVVNNSSQELIFIVGMPRSGSTLLENILSLNEEVVDLGEIEILSDIMKTYNPKIKGQNPYEKYVKEVKKLHPNAKITTDKNLFNYMFCPVISKYFENSKIIFCLRNPLDNILSIYRANFTQVYFSTSIEDITEIYIHHYELMKTYFKTYSKTLFFYNYDELVKNPSIEIKKIIDWLGWEWSNKYLAPHENKRSVFTASSEQIRNPIHSKSVGGWTKYKDLLEPAFPLISKNRDLKKYLK